MGMLSEPNKVLLKTCLECYEVNKKRYEFTGEKYYLQEMEFWKNLAKEETEAFKGLKVVME